MLGTSQLPSDLSISACAALLMPKQLMLSLSSEALTLHTNLSPFNTPQLVLFSVAMSTL
jgi:hypothetical protein